MTFFDILRVPWLPSFLEAMKMEIDIPAPKSGKIASINVNVNDAIYCK